MQEIIPHGSTAEDLLHWLLGVAAASAGGMALYIFKAMGRKISDLEQEQKTILPDLASIKSDLHGACESIARNQHDAEISRKEVNGKIDYLVNRLDKFLDRGEP